jgi:hypothetical protein
MFNLYSKNLFIVFIYIISIYSSARAMDLNELWQTKCDEFVTINLKNLRDTRSELKRPNFSFDITINVLDFIEKGKNTYGAGIVTETEQINELIIDICDVINLQHPDFKTRYDIIIEQWEDANQLPFSLFSFDRIAQVFYYQNSLFYNSEGSAYRRMVEQILNKEFIILRRAFCLIRDLDSERYHQKVPSQGALGDIYYLYFLRNINNYLTQFVSKRGSEKAKVRKEIKRKIPQSRVKGLCSISAMAHDYLTLSRIEEDVKTVLKINEFTYDEQKETFLAGIIQIGELSTNKNLSCFVRHQMPTIPWSDLVHCRDAIEHQDEHGFNTYFSELIDGTNTSINFANWSQELKKLNLRVYETRKMIWDNDPKPTFENWLEGELVDNPVYAVIPIASVVTIDQNIRRSFRQTVIFNGDANVWANLIKGEAPINHGHLQQLRAEIIRLDAWIPLLLNGSVKEKQEKTKNEKFVDSYKSVEAYLWDRLKREAVHLNEIEQNLLLQIVKDCFNIPYISNFCIALLKKDQFF